MSPKSLLLIISCLLASEWLTVGAEEVENHSIVSPQSSAQTSALDYSVCDKMFCIGMGSTEGSDCLPDKSCVMLLSGGFHDKDQGLTEFTLTALYGGDSQNGKYFSVGFSSDPKMGDDLVTDCYVTSDRKVKLGSSHNDGYNNQINSEFKDSLNSIQTSFSNGVVMCKWRSPRKRSINNKDWDFLDNKHYILLATGGLEDDTGSKSYHERKQASGQPISLGQVGAVSAASDPLYLVRIHGSFMVVSWIGLVSLGIMCARYFKDTWSSSTLCGVKIWFAFHRGLMVTAVVLMACAQICIFYYVKGIRLNLHSIAGGLAVGLAFLNPIGALLRPHPDAPNRWLFNWGHWAGGNAGHILAIVAIFLSTGLKLADLPKQFLWTVIAFVVFYVIIHLILQIHAFFMQSQKTHDIALQDMSRDSDDPDMGTDAPGSGFRRFILGIYCVVVLAFVIAMVSMISLPKSTLELMSIT